MAINRGSHIQEGRGVGELEINQLFLEAQREVRPAPGSGIIATNVGNMQQLSLSPEVVDPANVRMSFVGQITSEGPDGEGDGEGSLYWVREMSLITRDDSESNVRLQFRLTDDVREDAYHGQQHELGFRPTRWLAATNLGEYNAENPELESHALVFGPTRTVRVFLIPNTADKPRWYFDRAGGGTQLGVVRSIPSDTSPTVGVQAVQKNPETGVREFVGDVVQIACWAGLFGRHYVRHKWPMVPGHQEDPILDEVNILEVVFVDNEWQVKQTMRYSFPTPPPDKEEPPISDCQVVRPV